MLPACQLRYNARLAHQEVRSSKDVKPQVSVRTIRLRGVHVHNLKHVDLDLTHRQLIAFCGLSGSGKTSLALDTLYAEGQRRYIESFSAYTRQFLERLDKPAAERIEGIPPAIAVTRKSASRSTRATIGTATETSNYLRLLLARIGQVVCHRCGASVQRDHPESVARTLSQVADGTRMLLAFPAQVGDDAADDFWTEMREAGFLRAIVDGRLVRLDDSSVGFEQASSASIVIDRLVAGQLREDRLRDSLETAFAHGKGHCIVFQEGVNGLSAQPTEMIDGRPWLRCGFTNYLRCEDCDIDYPEPEPGLLSFNSPLGACPECEGFGNTIDIDMDLVVPDRSKSIREGAIAPWNTPAYAHELEELLALASDYDLPVDVPYRKLSEAQQQLIRHGVPEREFGGLDGFFAWLERRKYKMHLRVFLSRWRSSYPCPSCQGARLRPESLAVRLAGLNMAELCGMKVAELVEWFDRLDLTAWQQEVGQQMRDQVASRLKFLESVGLGYLTLDRRLRTLSGGEAQRVALTSSLGSTLSGMLYVLDEPSIGLHARDTSCLVDAIQALRDRGNTVVVVEHEEELIRAADEVVELGPAAGERGGQVVFQGTPQEMEQDERSLTGGFLARRRGIALPNKRRPPDRGWIRLRGARGNNLRDLTVEFPLGVLCLVTGVSGSGKSTLVNQTLYPALCRRLRKEATKPLDCDDVIGDGQLDDVLLVDQSPIGRSPRSNPVTYVKAFDAIRNVFAETLEARTQNLQASHFSFNVAGGRCNQCEGDGFLQVDMQFMPDVYMRCSQCSGRRYRREILNVCYRARNIADVLEMTVREAFTFFRGHPKVQTRLKRLIDVGLDYLRLGQGANTLSGGEAQRLKLASYMSTKSRNRTLFLLDEPTTGLHYSDVMQLIDCFESLLAVGHSLIVVEHNLQMMKAADHLIDLGPGAGDQGGAIVAEGTPEQIADCADSVTGRYLGEALAVAQE